MPSLRTAGLFVHTGRFSNNTALIQSPEADQHQSEISPLTASESFTQRRRRSIGAGSLHANGSVNGATVATSVQSSSSLLCVRYQAEKSGRLMVEILSNLETAGFY